MQERDAARRDRLVELCGEVVGLRPLNHRPEVEIGKFITVALHRARVPELERRDHRVIHLEKLRQQSALHDVARIRGAALLGVGKALLHVTREIFPLRVVPDSPRVEAFLFEHVALAQVASRVATLRPLVRPPTNTNAPSSGVLMSASLSSAPLPDKSVAGSPRAPSSRATR